MKTYTIEKLDNGYVMECDGYKRAFENEKSLEDFLLAKYKEAINNISAKSKRFSINIEAKSIVE